MKAPAPNLKRLTLLLVFGCMISLSGYAQAADTLQGVLRPRIGLGTGVMTYYGEVQNYQTGFTPMISRFGGSVYANAPISRMFNLEFTASYAKIAANERTLVRNYNFESRIRMGSAILYYNFYPLFQDKRRYFHPFIGTGIASFEFLSKTDLLDANGNQYYYWSDGSIMNMDEDNPLAPTEAVPLKRDYTYETDLRELNLDDLGKYREQSLAIPLSVGAEWHLSPRWDFRIATTYYFTFTDLIDNVSEAGTGLRQGDAKNDRLLFTSIGLSYDLKLNKKSASDTILMDEDGIPLYAFYDPNDYDKDGVIDALDKCPATPLEALVDSSGCPLDKDQDGVPDYRDDEPNTPPDTFVDEFGVTITEEDIADHLRLYYDSTGYEHEFVEYYTEIILNKQQEPSVKLPNKKTRTNLKYVIIVGKERKDVTVNDLHKYLGYNEYSTLLKGDTIYYTLGEYDSIEEAVAAKTGLESDGVKVDEIGRNSGDGETILTVDNEVVEKVKRIVIANGQEGPDYSGPGQIFRIQLGAFSKKIDTDEVYPGLDVVYGASQRDNLNRYYTGSFDNFEEAAAYQNELKKKGYDRTFIVAYERQERVTLVEAGVEESDLPEDYDEEKELETFVEQRDTTSQENESLTVDMSKVKYRVQLAYFEGDIPVETVDILYNIKNIKPVRSEDGSTTYYSQAFDTEDERDASMELYESYGLQELVPVIEYESVIYTVEEFKRQFGK